MQFNLLYGTYVGSSLVSVASFIYEEVGIKDNIDNIGTIIIFQHSDVLKSQLVKACSKDTCEY